MNTISSIAPSYFRNNGSEEDDPVPEKVIIAYAVPMCLHIAGIIIMILFSFLHKKEKKQYRTLWYVAIITLAVCELLRNVCYIVSFASEVHRNIGKRVCPYLGYFNLGVIYAASYSSCFSTYVMYRSLAKFSTPLNEKQITKMKYAIIIGVILIAIVIPIVAGLGKAFAPVDSDNDQGICWFNLNRKGQTDKQLTKLALQQFYWNTLQWVCSIIIQLIFIIAMYVEKRKLIKKYKLQYKKLNTTEVSNPDSAGPPQPINVILRPMETNASENINQARYQPESEASSQLDEQIPQIRFTSITNNINYIGIPEQNTLKKHKPSRNNCCGKLKRKNESERQIFEMMLIYDDDANSNVEGEMAEKVEINSSVSKFSKRNSNKQTKRAQKESNRELKMLSFTFWFSPLILIIVSIGAFLADNVPVLVAAGATEDTATGVRCFSFWIVSNGLFLPLVYVLPVALVSKRNDQLISGCAVNV